MLSLYTLAVLLCTSLLCVAQGDVNKFAERHYQARAKRASAPAESLPLEARKSDYRYYNQKTAPYFIEKWPYVHFDTGEFYSGSVPIDESDPSRTLFFIFKPAIAAPSTDLTIWLNGGPGCSSLVGFFQENGPILWQPGTYAPSKNPYTWANLTNMLWVEQPVGTGFAQGKVTAKNERDVARDFANFFKNFEKLFSIENYKVYVTGESYAGRYVPYISAEMLDRNDKQYFDLSGALVYDPCIGDFVLVGQEIPTYPFVLANNEILNINQSVLDKMESMHNKCGYADFIDKYMTFPPPGNQPQYPVYSYGKCDIFDIYAEAAYDVNPCFNIYHITDYCPLLGDVIGNPGGLPCLPQHPYFNLPEVKQALHAPDIHWFECTGPVFKGKGGPEGEDDDSKDPIQNVLPQVIEATNRVIVSNADWDGLLLTNGTLLSIQNMTWNGKLGFQKAPSKPVIVASPNFDLQFGESPYQGEMGIQHYERGLLWVETYQAGHMQPEYQPRATYDHIRWLLGEIDTL